MSHVIQALLESHDMKNNNVIWGRRGGYLYCIWTNIQHEREYCVKLGKTRLHENESEDKVRNRLFQRYKTYYPEARIIMLVRVSNCDEAEIKLFELLDTLRVSNELFVFKESIIYETMNNVKHMYTNVNEVIKMLSSVELSVLNSQLRRLFRSKLEGHMEVDTE